MISRSLLLGAACFGLLLSGCGTGDVLRYQADITISDTSKMPILFESIERVLIRRFAALGINQPKVTVVPSDTDSAVVTIEVRSTEEKEAAEHIVTDPFIFDLRLDAGTEMVEGEEVTKWESAGVDGTMLNWVQAIGNRETSQVSIDLQFNEEGKVKLRELATTHRGKRLGIFVRDLLVSALTIESGSFADHVVISGIPSAAVAEVFADDVNVGLHVTFTPL